MKRNRLFISVLSFLFLGLSLLIADSKPNTSLTLDQIVKDPSIIRLQDWPHVATLLSDARMHARMKEEAPYDKNKDENVDADTYDAFVKARHIRRLKENLEIFPILTTRFDQDGDGWVTIDELRNELGETEKKIAAMPLNSDEQLLARYLKDLKYFDVNKDGFLSDVESPIASHCSDLALTKPVPVDQLKYPYVKFFLAYNFIEFK